MSLRHALLGLLAQDPASGYDLTQQFEEGIGSFAWTAKHSQIYPELAKLAQEQLVEVVAEGARGRRVYDITAAGRETLRTWLLGPPNPGGTVRNEFVLRLFLLSALDDADALALLAGVAASAEQQIVVLEEQQAAMRAEGRPPTFGPNLAAQFGVYSYRAAADWARWTTAQLKTASEAPGVRH
jgi:DNA-binding PadR family transcriptional regulator